MASIAGARAPGTPVSTDPPRSHSTLPNQAVKASIRLLPPGLTEAAFLEQLGRHTSMAAILAFYYVQGADASKPFEEPVYSRAYLQVQSDAVYSQLFRQLKEKSFFESETEDSLVPVVSRALFHPMPKKEKSSRKKTKAISVSSSPEKTPEPKAPDSAVLELLELEKTFLFRKFVDFYNGNADSFSLIPPREEKLPSKATKKKKKSKEEPPEVQNGVEKPKKKKAKKAKKDATKLDSKSAENNDDKPKKALKKAASSELAKPKKEQVKAAKSSVEKGSNNVLKNGSKNDSQTPKQSNLEKSKKNSEKPSIGAQNKASKEQPTANSQQETAAKGTSNGDKDVPEQGPQGKKKRKGVRSKKSKESGSQKAGNESEKAVTGPEKDLGGPQKATKASTKKGKPKETAKETAKNIEDPKPGPKVVLQRRNEAPPKDTAGN